ncbi:MAG: bifunctional 2-polyprenyl-6-hydroxyphenol methylase/3-demethylubiquinol 3-O-methyltransferase UbiG [Magnetococcales bacterium]|nr:bifunctional 2-polyprenyl-6-hydroxyphenol methylase/3-demethylubiquinol 3-O-methyltransferase UbiG [Magnetococcales bacterium]
MSDADPAEIAKFEAMAHEWWDPHGKFKPLHRLNPLRTRYIRERMEPLKKGAGAAGLEVLDIGCGGGLLSESLAESGVRVMGIDRSEKTIGAAKAHQAESGSDVDYRVCATGDLLAERPASFDVVLAMEVLEHVPDPRDFLRECAGLLKPGGRLFFSTLNRTWQAWLMAIVGAEYVLRWLPRGTHDHDKFIKPGELCDWVRYAGLTPRDVSGMTYHPGRDDWTLSRNVSVNYLGFGEKLDG